MRPARLFAGACAAAAAAALLSTGAPAGAATFPSPCSAPPADAQSLHDIDSDAHREGDVAIGVPRAGSGYVDLTFDPQCAPHRQRVTQSHFTGLPTPGAHDEFGASVAYLPREGNAGLAIGAPGSDGGRGALVLSAGSSEGLARAGAVRLTGRSAGEHFGAAVTTSGADLFVAAPDRTVAGRRAAGAVDHYRLEADGTASFVGSITQDSAGVPGVAETGDRFGSRLAQWGADLFVGDPDEAVGGAGAAGTVTVLRFAGANSTLTAAQLLSQSGSWPGAAEAGDRFGAALTTRPGVEQVAIGIPGEDLGRRANAGAVQIARPNRSGRLDTFAVVRTVTQDSPGVPGVAESGDLFGAALVSTEWASCGNGADVVVGAPGEDVGSVRDAGSVTIVSAASGTSGLATACRRIWSKGAAGGLGGTPHAGERLGSVLWQLQSRWDGASLDSPAPTAPGVLIGVPGQDLGGATDAGAVFLLFPFGAVKASILHDSAGPRRGEQYGSWNPGGV